MLILESITSPYKQRMRILLVSNYPYDEQESMLRFAALLKAGLSEKGHEARILRQKPLLGRIKPGARGISKWLGYVDKFFLFPPVLAREARWADVVHICDHSNSMYVLWVRSKPHIVTCHDMLAVRSALGEIPENPTRFTGRQFQKRILNGLKHALQVACVSESTRRDLDRIAQRPVQSTSVVQNGLNYQYAPMPPEDAKSILAKLGVPSDVPFLLHVGGNQWYKNRLGVLRIFSELIQRDGCKELRLVLAGKSWTNQMREFIERRALAGKAIELTAISNEDLRALYSTAKALLFPSLEEGFGWPIIEAQACGCPVFTSNRSPMTEIAGNAGLYIDPADPNAAAKIIAEQLPGIESLQQASIRNASRFTTSAMISGYLKLYETLLHENSSRYSLS
jgi:glycosyltransferase involved in cell wall biosynthesis